MKEVAQIFLHDEDGPIQVVCILPRSQVIPEVEETL